MASGAYDVAIVSASGRGNLLAGELKTRGQNTVLIDVSSTIGERSMADLEGPFPIVRPTPILPSHLEWLMNHPFEDVDNGLSIWLKNGPVEFRGPLAAHYVEREPAVSAFRDYYADWLQHPARRSEFAKRTSQMPFSTNWLIELAHSLAATELHRAPECHTFGDPFPINQAIQIPSYNPGIFERTFEELKSLGVPIIKAEGLSDLHIDKNRLLDLEIEVGSRQVIQSRFWIWCLSFEETTSLSRRSSAKLYPKAGPVADWAWRRFRVHTGKNASEENVPNYVLLVNDLHFPWTSDNFVILKRHRLGLYDLWARLPAVESQKPDQLKKITTKLQERLQERLPHWSFQIEPPWDQGPPLYPVFDPETLKGFPKSTFANVLFEGPEFTSRLDFAGRAQAQTETMLRLQALKNELGESARNQVHDSAIHAP